MSLNDTDFSGRDLRFIIASNTGFQRCNFEGANLGGSNLRFAKMFYSNLKDTVLVGADLYASFSRWVNFSNSVMRESDVRNFHDQLIGTNKTISHTIALISGKVSIVSLVPAALQVLPISPALAPVLGLSVWTALNYRFVMEFGMGGWYFRPIKNMKEVLFNIEMSKIKENEKLLAECVGGNPVLMAENLSIKTVEQFKKQKCIDAEKIMNYEYEKVNKSKVDGILNRFRQRKDKNVNDDENVRIK